jgi:Holliday junction resolvase RusA-like endonuclease
MDFKASDFDKLTFNVYRLDTTKRGLFDYFPILETYFKELVDELNDATELDYNVVLKYVIFMYDTRTPLQYIDNILKRKMNAMELAGVPVDDSGNFIEAYISSFDGFSFEVNRIIVKYCRIQRNHDFSELKFYDDTFYSEMIYAKTESDATKRGKILENITKSKEQIKVLQEKILMGDNAPRLVNYLLSEVEDDTLGLRPEEIAEKCKLGFDPLNSYTPYA